MSAQRDVIHEVIGRSNDGVVILDYFFQYSDGFRGATGAIVRPVTQAEIDDFSTLESLEDYYEGAWRDDAGRPNGTTMSLSEYVGGLDVGEYIERRFEELGWLSTEEIAEAVGMKRVPARYEVISMGHMFPGAIDDESFVPLDTDRARELIARIREIEGE